MVQSYFELYIFEILYLSWSQFLVIYWVSALEATTGVEPTILIKFRIVFHFDEHADLCHNHVTEAKVAALNVYSCVTCFVTPFLGLLPNIEIDSVRRVVILPLRSSRHSLVALRHVSYVQVAIVLVSLFHWCPGETHTHCDRIAVRYLVGIKINRREGHMLCSVPLVEFGVLVRVANGFHVIFNSRLHAVVLRLDTADQLHSLE